MVKLMAIYTNSIEDELHINVSEVEQLERLLDDGWKVIAYHSAPSPHGTLLCYTLYKDSPGMTEA